MIRRLVFLARVQKRAGSTTHHLSTAAVQAASERSRGAKKTPLHDHHHEASGQRMPSLRAQPLPPANHPVLLPPPLFM